MDENRWNTNNIIYHCLSIRWALTAKKFLNESKSLITTHIMRTGQIDDSKLYLHENYKKNIYNWVT